MGVDNNAPRVITSTCLTAGGCGRHAAQGGPLFSVPEVQNALGPLFPPELISLGRGLREIGGPSFFGLLTALLGWIIILFSRKAFSMHSCPTCQKPVTHRKRKYCSRGCHQAQTQKVTGVCAQCGSPFWRYRSQLNHQESRGDKQAGSFCSRSCYHLAMGRTYSNTPSTKSLRTP